MEHSESIGKIAKALGDFQGVIAAVGKTATNPFFHSKYAPLEAIIAHVTKAMRANGLSYAQFPDGEGLTTILMHDESGEWMKATMKVHMGSKPQDQGSAITYARRYALSAVLGLATEDDDDGNAASAPKPSVASVAPKTAPQRTETSEAANREKAKKDRILANLKRLGKSVKNKEEVSQAVFDLVGLELAPEKFDEIGEALGKLK